LIVGATAAGVGATLLTAKKESIEAKQAFEELKADVGSDSSAFMQAVKHAYGAQRRGEIVGTGGQLVSDVANGAMGMSGHVEAAMMGVMALPMAIPMLVGDHPTLNAYKALKTGQLDGEQKMLAVKQLIAVLPTVPQHQNVFNRTVVSAAKEMVAQNMDAKAIVQLIADEAKFNAFLKELNAKQTEALKAKAANESGAEAAAVPAAANDHTAHMNAKADTTAPYPASHAAANAQGHAHTTTHSNHPPHLAAGTKIMNNHNDNDVASHDGMVAAAHRRAVGQN
jgi:hypothetical protein